MPNPEKKRKSVLKTQLLLAFCALAVLPAFSVLFLQIRTSESNLAKTVDTVTSVGRSSIEESSNRIADSALKTLATTSEHLIKLGVGAIDKTSDTLMGISKDKLQNSSRQVIDLSQQTNQQMADGMVKLSQEASEKMSGELIALSASANRDLAQTTSGIAEKAVQNNTLRLIEINDRLADELTDYLTQANQKAALDTSKRLMGELEREPLVNFRVLAQIMAQTFAGGKITDRKEAYISVVDDKGLVLASTRYKRDTSLAHVEIVKRALHDPTKVAADMPLISYKDGGENYLGVYARKSDGGAVIVAYNLAKAQEDLNALGGMVNGSFENLVKTTTSGTKLAISGNTPRIKLEADDLTKQTIGTIKKESDRVSRQSAEEMAARATKTSRTYAEGMNVQAKTLASQSSTIMQDRSQEILQKALVEMAPIGKRYAKQAAEAMTPQAQRAVAEIKGQLQPLIREASLKAAARMLPEAQAALVHSRRATIAMGLGILIAAILFGLIVSYFLSGKIADPVEVEKKLRKAELSRMGKEMEIATRIQTCLIPKDFAIQQCDLTMGLVTATEVGGDLIDYFPQPDGEFWLAVGDVTGHGLTPGLVMMMAQTSFTSQVMAAPKESPSKILGLINQALHQNVKYRLGNDNYMTLQLIRHEGEGRFVAAGMHCDILIYRAKSRTVERIEIPGFWTGLIPDISEMTEDIRFALQPEDILLLYTDGLVEAANAQEEQYDMERLGQALIRYADLPVEEIKANILAEVKNWYYQQLDDISIILLRWNGAPVPSKEKLILR